MSAESGGWYRTARRQGQVARARTAATSVPDSLGCDTCGSAVPAEDARRRETIGDLDPTKWQTFCCPDCGRWLKTVFVGDE
ncbi:hypothetical protein BRD14_04705 [Halobacteriales archaeon SW_5_68_122]|nr:MAG: hypothetical protein BRD14_04705 [Halobacteriales archaeon SW_5_68_122]